MAAFSYKEALTNALIALINRRIKESKDLQSKVEELDEEKKKKFHQKVVDFVISRAKGLAEIQGTNYVGVEDPTVEMWINDFFDEFEENMKEPEKPKTTSTPQISKNKTFEVSEGLFELEVKYDKKTILTKEAFIKKIKEDYKGKEVVFDWQQDKVTIKEKTKKEPKPKEEMDEDEENDQIQMKLNEEAKNQSTDEEDENKVEEESEEIEDKNEDEEKTEEEDGLF